MRVRQITPTAHFPSGDRRTIAVLRLEPEALTQRFGLVFESGHDDLDWYQLAAIKLTRGDEVWLLRYKRAPHSGTEIVADAGTDAKAIRTEVLQDLELTSGDLAWSLTEKQVDRGR